MAEGKTEQTPVEGMVSVSVEEKMESILTETRVFNPEDLNAKFAKTGISMSEYKELYKQSIEDPKTFWGEQAELIDWFKPYEKVWEKTDLFPGKWFSGGKLNVSYNCIDRHVKAGKGDHKRYRITRSVQVQRAAQRALPVLLERFLRLVSGMGQAPHVG